MNPAAEKKCVMIVAGEASGDHHGARLVTAMAQTDPSIFFFGIGGKTMANAGVRLMADLAAEAVVGFTEALFRLPLFYKALQTARAALTGLKPDLLILIDFPGFNLHLAPLAKKLGIPVLYYIGPQVWAWRRGRVNKIRRLVDHMAVILPFEADFYQQHRVPATFVGHPLLDADETAVVPVSEPSAQTRVVGLLPGSRNKEVRRHLPVMLQAARILAKKQPGLRFVVSAAPTVERPYLEEMTAEFSRDLDLSINGEIQDVFDRSFFLLAASGTVTLQAALTGTPMVIIYKLSYFSAWLGWLLIKVPFISLVNLIAQKQVVPELLQHRATAKNIAETAWEMISRPEALEQTRKALLALRKRLGRRGASAKVAQIAFGMMDPAAGPGAFSPTAPDEAALGPPADNNPETTHKTT